MVPLHHGVPHRSLFFGTMKTQLLFVAVALVLVESVPMPAELGPVYEGLCACVVKNITHPNPGQYVPQCDANGNFRRLQCWGSVGSCWCANPLTGEKINGTETYPGQAPPDCEERKPHCPEHWTEHEDHCYIFIDSPKSWVEAESYCQFEEGHLASINCPKTNHFLQALTKGNTHEFPESWVGGTNAVQVCFWMWSDGSHFDFEDWYSEKCKYREDSCLKINYGCNTNQLKWGSACCNETLPFVCSREIEHWEHHD